MCWLVSGWRLSMMVTCNDTTAVMFDSVGVRYSSFWGLSVVYGVRLSVAEARGCRRGVSRKKFCMSPTRLEPRRMGESVYEPRVRQADRWFTGRCVTDV
jgi:hypothetical protein